MLNTPYNQVNVLVLSAAHVLTSNQLFTGYQSEIAKQAETLFAEKVAESGDTITADDLDFALEEGYHECGNGDTVVISWPEYKINQYSVTKNFFGILRNYALADPEFCGQYPGSWLAKVYFAETDYAQLGEILGDFSEILAHFNLIGEWGIVVSGENSLEDFFEAVMIQLLVAYGVLTEDTEHGYAMKDIERIDIMLQAMELSHDAESQEEFTALQDQYFQPHEREGELYYLTNHQSQAVREAVDTTLEHNTHGENSFDAAPFREVRELFKTEYERRQEAA